MKSQPTSCLKLLKTIKAALVLECKELEKQVEAITNEETETTETDKQDDAEVVDAEEVEEVEEAEETDDAEDAEETVDTDESTEVELTGLSDAAKDESADERIPAAEYFQAEDKDMITDDSLPDEEDLKTIAAGDVK